MSNRNPYTGKPMQLRLEKTVMNFRKEPFEVIYHSYFCEDTGEEFEDDSLSVINYTQVVDLYREKHNIPFPEQIKAIRESYGLSARRISEILGLGTNTWRLYENGEVPTIANARLIQLIGDPANFLKHITEFGACEEREIEKMKKKIGEIQEDISRQHLLETMFQVTLPDKSTGFSMFNKEKTEQVISYFTGKMQPYKTAMNKLLFYADFLHFKRTGRSITGLRYAAIDFGPVPDHYGALYEMMFDSGIILISGSMTDYGFTERFLLPEGKETNTSVFTEQEMETLQKVFEELNGKSTVEIVDLSHKEDAWVQYQSTKSIIPYFMAFYLKAIK